MKPCRRYRRAITLMSAGALESSQAGSVREHLRDCPACQNYSSQMTALAEQLHQSQTLPQVEATETFYRQWTREIMRPSSAASAGSPFSPVRWLPRWAFGAAATAMLATALLFFVWHRNPPPGPSAVSPEAMPSALPSDSPRSFAVYRHVAGESLDALDQLLNRQAQTIPSSPTYRLSTPGVD